MASSLQEHTIKSSETVGTADSHRHAQMRRQTHRHAATGDGIAEQTFDALEGSRNTFDNKSKKRGQEN